MKTAKFSVWFVTVFLVIYTLSPYMHVPYWIIGCAYLLSPFLVIWMVWSVLTKGSYTGPTFDEGYFYDDKSAPQSVDVIKGLDH